jgi:uncharacterized protein YkwD
MGGCWLTGVCLTFLALVAGCRGGSHLLPYLPTPAQTPTGGDAPNLAELEAKVMAGMNEERRNRGLPPLGSDSRLTAAAQVHSRDMAQGNFFDHRGRDGSWTGERLSAQGYGWSFYAENIACRQRSAEQVLKSWLDSKAHRDNILSTKAEHAGVGVAVREGTDCVYYWTAVLAAER